MPTCSAPHLDLRRKGVALQLILQGYREAHRDGYQYSRFCDLHRAWANRLPAVKTLRAGEGTFLHFSGDRVTVVNPDADQCQEAPLRVMLGASNLTWAEPMLSERLPTWHRP